MLLTPNYLTVEPQLITISVLLTHNYVDLLAEDSQRRLISAEFEFWAGDETAYVSVVDEQGAPFAGATDRLHEFAVTSEPGGKNPSSLGLPRCVYERWMISED